jgi:hypothetical protein
MMEAQLQALETNYNRFLTLVKSRNEIALLIDLNDRLQQEIIYMTRTDLTISIGPDSPKQTRSLNNSTNLTNSQEINTKIDEKSPIIPKVPPKPQPEEEKKPKSRMVISYRNDFQHKIWKTVSSLESRAAFQYAVGVLIASLFSLINPISDQVQSSWTVATVTCTILDRKFGNFIVKGWEFSVNFFGIFVEISGYRDSSEVWLEVSLD